MRDLDGEPALDPVTGLAVGPHAPHEGRVAARVTECDDLVVEGREPEVWVIVEAGSQVRHERLDGIRGAAASDTGFLFTADIGTDRLAVAPEMAGDRRDRPASLVQCVDFHVFSLCEHGAGLLRCCGFDTVSIVGASSPVWMDLSGPGPRAQGWGVSVIVSGESPVIVSSGGYSTTKWWILSRRWTRGVLPHLGGDVHAAG